MRTRSRFMRVLLAAAMLVAPLAPAQTPPDAPAVSAPADSPSGGRKVLRYAFRVAETGFDPARINDLYSRTVTPHIFEGLYTYDHLARPSKVRPLTATGMPVVSEDFRVWTVEIQRGIHFADDPAFGGKRRELTAADYVYAFKRFADPAVRSPVWSFLEQFNLLGLAELRKQALETRKPFDYDAPIEGLQARDRYTLQFRMAQPRPRFLDTLAVGDLFGAVAREVVERYGEDIVAHPVGTGPFRLVQWRRSSFIALERNAGYRDVRYDAQPAPDDAEGQAILAKLKGRRLPMVDRVEISIIDEEQPRWLTFLNGHSDVIDQVPPEFAAQAMPNGVLAPNHAARGIQAYRDVQANAIMTLFNMEDPVVGGYTAEKVALRRAIGLATDVQREIRLIRHQQAIPAQSPVMPHTTGYDPAFKSENGDYDPARARALLDMYGYVDKDGDGWREMPDGSPLVLRVATQPDSVGRKEDELRKRDMDAIGIRVTFEPAKWPENLKLARSGKLMVWGVGLSAAGPDGQGSLARYHSVQAGGQNLARFKLAAFDAIYERMLVMPDGPERDELFFKAKQLTVAYMPYKQRIHRIVTDMAHPWVIGYRRPVMWQDWWHMVDIDHGAAGAVAKAR